MATFNRRPIEKKLKAMKFRSLAFETDFLANNFIERHPNIDILSISTSFVNYNYCMTTIWYTEGNNAK